MKTLSEIRRDIVSFYSSIQNRVTDFSFGSVISGIFYSVSAVVEEIYSEIRRVENQAYIATATGTYLDRLIEGTFQLTRTSATRNFGYVTLYSDSPIPEDVVLTYVGLDENRQNFTSTTESATKFIAFPSEGDEGIVYVLAEPENTTDVSVDTDSRTITIPAGSQYVILPVASVQTGSQVRIREGDLSSFPESPPEFNGVINTLNPGAIFNTTEEYTGGAPFSSRFTTVRSFNGTTGVFTVDNAFNFNNTGLVEVREDIFGNQITATYTQNPDGTGSTFTAGLIFDYANASLSTISLSSPIPSGSVPTVSVAENGSTSEYTLYSFSYTFNSTTYTFTNNVDNATFLGEINDFLIDVSDTYADFVVYQRRKVFDDSTVFDIDSQLQEDGSLLSSAAISGATDEASDDEYREALQSYLSSLGKATDSSLVTGALQVPGISSASILPNFLTPKGSSIVVASDTDGFLSADKLSEIKTVLDEQWKASGVNIIVRGPDRIAVHVSLNVKISDNANQNLVTNAIISATENYFANLNPGESISYITLLNTYSNLTGVTNVFNLIISKRLTDDTYEIYKAEYDEQILTDFVKGSIYSVEEVPDVTSLSSTYLRGDVVFESGGNYHVYDGTQWLEATNDPFISTNEGDIVIFDTDSGELDFQTYDENSPLDLEEYNLLSFDTPRYIRLGVIYSTSGAVEILRTNNNDVLAFNLYKGLSSVTTTEELRLTLETYKNQFPGTENEFYYLLSYAFSETIDDLILSTFPIDPELVLSQNIQNYTSESYEVYKLDSFTYNNVVRTAVGINYL